MTVPHRSCPARCSRNSRISMLPGDVRHLEASAGESCVNLPRWMYGGLWESCRTFLDYWRCYTWCGRLSRGIAPCWSTRARCQNRAIVCSRRNSSNRRMKSPLTSDTGVPRHSRFWQVDGRDERGTPSVISRKFSLSSRYSSLSSVYVARVTSEWDAAATQGLQSVHRQVFGVACHW